MPATKDVCGETNLRGGEKSDKNTKLLPVWNLNVRLPSSQLFPHSCLKWRRHLNTPDPFREKEQGALLF